MPVKTKKVFEDRPRWKGAPPICLKENLPAFKDQKEINQFISRNCPGANIIRQGRCGFCKHLHYVSEMPGPSGTTSGKHRSK